MSKLEFKLERFDHIVVFQVVNQSEDITSKGKLLSYTASNGINICSEHCVALYKDGHTIHIGGNTELTGADSTIFEDSLSAQTYFERTLYALKEWANNGYFKEPIPIEYNEERGTYSV